jgi:trehalose/maltose transport system permease protein
MSQRVETAAPARPSRRRPWQAEAPRSAWARQRERLGWLLIAPSLLVVVVVGLYPLVRTFALSLTNERLGSSRPVSFIGLLNYTDLLTNPTFLGAIRNTLVFTIASVTLELVLGLVIALVIHSNFKGRGLVRTSMLIPWAIPTVVAAQMWAWMYNDVFGVFNDLAVTRLHLLPEKIAWTANPATAMAAIVAVDVWKTTPFMALLLLAGLQVIPVDMYEAAHVDGANRWQQFWQLTLPNLRPAILVALIFRTMDALRVFDVIFVMKGTAPETISMSIFARQTMIDLQRLGEGSAASVIIFLIIGAFVVFYTRLVRVEEA